MSQSRKETDEAAIEAAIEDRLLSLENFGDQQPQQRRTTMLRLARELKNMPGESARVAVEMSAAVAGVSLRAGAEFLRHAAAAARVLTTPGELRAWAETGRRLAMSDAEAGVKFFAGEAAGLADLSPPARTLLFEICSKQLVLSSAFALETFHRAPSLARAVDDPELLRAILQTTLDISRRSAKHSAEFLAATPQVVRSFKTFGERSTEVAGRAVALTNVFAVRAGGIAAEVWTATPNALRGLGADQALVLLDRVGEFLEQSGSAALHLLPAGARALRTLPGVFDDWCDLLRLIAAKGNAVLVAFVRSSPGVFKSFADGLRRNRISAAQDAVGVSPGDSVGGDAADAERAVRRMIAATRQVAEIDGEAAISCFRSSAEVARRSASLEQYERWAHDGLSIADARARRSYYALETRRSHEALAFESEGLSLEAVAPTLRLYVEGLTGRQVAIEPNANPGAEAAPIGDGRTVRLPPRVAEFADDAINFRLYKVLAAHAAGQIEFGTNARGTDELRAAYQALGDLYAAENVDALDAFALGGYINDLRTSEAALAPEEEARRHAAERRRLPDDGDYRQVLALFPEQRLAGRIFATLENGRIDRRLRHAYRGLARDLDFVAGHLRTTRPAVGEVPLALVPFELLFQITLCGGVRDDARRHFGQIVSELETIVASYVSGPASGVADTLLATERVYALFQSITPESSRQESSETEPADDGGEAGAATDEAIAAADTPGEVSRDPPPRRRDARELFSSWLANDMAGEPDNLDAAEALIQTDVPERALGEDECAFNYDEWDRELTDHRVEWCRVVEKRGAAAVSSAFVDQARERYRGTISSIRHQFQLIKPENLKRVNGELDGDDYDLNAVIDYAVDRRSNGHQSERLYVKRLRRERDVAVSLLLDQSSSTARTIGRHPLQPYTHPGRRIIEIEKEGLVLMSEALEAVGDAYSINGFTSEGRRNVRFYVVKDFDERYSDDVAKRIGGITYQNNTRLGAAIRHAAARLSKQEARTRLLIVLSDGRPYDHDYGDARYAREDTREALRQAKLAGITSFCITIDRDSEAELRDLYGEVGYTIIDDVLNLPERLPAIYRRLTS